MTATITESTRQQLVKDLRETGDGFTAALDSFSPDDFNKVPFAGSWTPGQVGEHIYKSISGMPQLLNGHVEATLRDPAENIPVLEKIFLDFSTKLQSPDFILPSDKKHDKGEMVSSLGNVFARLLAIAEKEDLSLTCIDFKFPNMGHFTRQELLHFAYVHSKRHIHQLQKIKGAV
ncbi:MAG: DinB family protein [Chitinophagaceae bacterium]|nr:MAG: DinB family protein [Chitinophagaceae bacterium]